MKNSIDASGHELPGEEVRFSCKRCGACCRWPGHVLLSEGDIAGLSAFLGMEEQTFIDQFADLASNRRELTLKEAADGACILLKDSLCQAYPERPAQCRNFPHQWTVEGCPGLVS